MNFPEVMENLKKYLETIESRDVLQDKRDFFIKTSLEIERHFIFMSQSDNKPDVINEHILDIKSCLEFLIEIYPYVVISKGLYTFVTSYCLLVSNWNNNVCNNGDIEKLVNLTDRIYKQHMTVVESFDILKVILQRCERLQSFSLPSVELSKHYLESLDREVSKQND